LICGGGGVDNFEWGGGTEDRWLLIFGGGGVDNLECGGGTEDLWGGGVDNLGLLIFIGDIAILWRLLFWGGGHE